MRSFILFSSILIVILVLNGCSEPESHDNTTTIRPVKLLTVNDGAEERIRSFPAIVEAAAVAELAFRVGGEVAELPVKPGTQVDQDELVAKLDQTDYQLVVDEAQARYELASSQFARGENLVQQGVMSQAEFDEMRSNLEVSRANAQTAQQNLRYTELRAPFAGTIAQVFIERYENIQPQQAIATLQLSDAIDVSIQVPESLFARVQRRENVAVDVIFDASPGQRYQAQLKEWDSTADPATNTYKVVFTLPTPIDINALPGMSATVAINTQSLLQRPITALTIPAQAVFSPPDSDLEGQRYVWIYKSGKVTRRAVEVGELSNRGLAITSGLAAGDTIVVAGVHQLQEGQSVKPWEQGRGR